MRVDVGHVIAGKYELVRLLGKGAMGEVWKAVHNTLGGDVAIKLVEPADDTEAETAAGRFQLEAQIAAKLSRRTRHIVSVSDHGEENGLAYLVMELLEGQSLEQRVARNGPLGLADVAAMVSQVARALHLAHEEGIFHRDIKPANIWLGRDEDERLLVKLLDFGIARSKKPFRTRSPFATSKDMVLGTPSYMSPEQARGLDSLDHRCDVWALAVVAYEALAKKLPFDGESLEDIFLSICTFRVIPLRTRRPDLAPAVEAIFTRAFTSKLDERFGSAAEFSEAFEQLVTPAEMDFALGIPATSSSRRLDARRSDPQLAARASSPQLEVTQHFGSDSSARFAAPDSSQRTKRTPSSAHINVGSAIDRGPARQTAPVMSSPPDFAQASLVGRPPPSQSSHDLSSVPRPSYPETTGPIVDMNVTLGTAAPNRSSNAQTVIIALLALLLLLGVGAVVLVGFRQGPTTAATQPPLANPDNSSPQPSVETANATAAPTLPTLPTSEPSPKASAAPSKPRRGLATRPSGTPVAAAPIARPPAPTETASSAPSTKPVDKGNVF